MLPTGTLIDEKYEIVSTLGVGGFGAVYRAVHKQFDRNVAIKLLDTTLLLESDGLPRFEREAKAINCLLHKNIVGFYGYGAFQQAPYMVMELVDGTSVDKLIAKEQRIKPLRALQLTRQVFEALACAHNSGVVHRDLKPSNLMVTVDADGRECVKIIDFGLAKLMPGYGVPGQKLTETGYALGTCHYMAPEQALGGVIDQRADIYAAGCILYQMIAGRLPFDAENNIAIMYQHLNEKPEPLSKFVQGPEPLDAISVFINNCMAKKPEERYQSCTEALTDLDALLKGQLNAVAPLAVRQMAAVNKRSNNGPIKLVLACLALACVAVLGFGLWQFEQEAELKHQLGSDRATLVPLIRSREQSLTYSDAKTLEAIKSRDDDAHHLLAGERMFLLMLLANTYLLDRPVADSSDVKKRLEFARQYAREAFLLSDRLGNTLDDKDFWWGLGRTSELLVMTGQTSLAAQCAHILERSQDLPSRSHGVWFELDTLLCSLKPQECEQRLQAKLRRDPETAHPRMFDFCTLGVAKIMQCDFDAAERYYEQALQIGMMISDPQEAYAGLSRVALFKGDYERALDYARKAQEVRPSEMYLPGVMLEEVALVAAGNRAGARQMEARRKAYVGRVRPYGMLALQTIDGMLQTEVWNKRPLRIPAEWTRRVRENS